MNKFIVSGVPRSGTTALADLLNWHPTVFCGIERFPLATVEQADFCREAVNDESIPSAHYSRNKAVLEDKPRLDAIGDKGPRYFYRLAGSAKDFSDTKLVFIVRNIADVFNSWNARAFNENDMSWHRGQTGVFSYLDLLQMLFAMNQVQETHDAIIVSYEELFFGESSRQHLIIDQVFEFLDAPRSEAVHQSFDAETAKRLSLKKKKPDLSKQEFDFIDLVKLTPLYSRLAESDGVIAVNQLDTLTRVQLQDFHERRHEILTALDKLLLPQTGISQAMTVMRLCYQLSRGNNLFTAIRPGASPDSSNFELLALLFNASQDGRHQDARKYGEELLERFPECSELLVEMSTISSCLNDRASSIRYTKRAIDVQPDNTALFSRLKHLINKRT